MLLRHKATASLAESGRMNASKQIDPTWMSNVATEQPPVVCLVRAIDAAVVERLQELRLIVEPREFDGRRRRLSLKYMSASQCQVAPTDLHRRITTDAASTQLTNSPANILCTVLGDRLQGAVTSRQTTYKVSKLLVACAADLVSSYRRRRRS